MASYELSHAGDPTVRHEPQLTYVRLAAAQKTNLMFIHKFGRKALSALAEGNSSLYKEPLDFSLSGSHTG
jgi:hypothetical protein